MAASSRRRCSAVFGGSFNPPHVSHMLAVSYVLAVAEVDEVLVVPVYQHPFDKALAPYEDRLAMSRLAMGWLPGAEVSDIERRLGGESRTLYTIEALLEEDPERDLRLVIGADVIGDLPKWHRWDRIRELAPPIVLGRAGIDEDEAPSALLPEVSSTDVRRALAAGEVERIAHLVPRAVLERVRARGLYGVSEGS